MIADGSAIRGQARRSPGRSGARWRKASARVRARDTHCWLCLEPLTTLAWPHPRSTSVHHIVALAAGGSALDEANLTGTHRACNEAVGAKVVPAGYLAAGRSTSRPSRRWFG